MTPLPHARERETYISAPDIFSSKPALKRQAREMQYQDSCYPHGGSEILDI